MSEYVEEVPEVVEEPAVVEVPEVVDIPEYAEVPVAGGIGEPGYYDDGPVRPRESLEEVADDDPPLDWPDDGSKARHQGYIDHPKRLYRHHHDDEAYEIAANEMPVENFGDY